MAKSSIVPLEGAEAAAESDSLSRWSRSALVSLGTAVPERGRSRVPLIVILVQFKG